MTCIVGLEYRNKVYLGGDRAQSGDWIRLSMSQPKVFVKDDVVFGYTSSFRFGNLLQYTLQIPKPETYSSIEEFVYVRFVEAIRQCLKAGGYSRVDNNVEKGGTCLFGFRSKLYQIQDDFSVVKNNLGYDAVGSGFLAALGSLHTTDQMKIKSPTNRITLALEAATALVPSVAAPYDIVSV